MPHPLLTMRLLQWPVSMGELRPLERVRLQMMAETVVEEQREATRNAVSVDTTGVCSRVSECLVCHDGVLKERQDAPESVNDRCRVSTFAASLGIGVEMMSAAHDVIANNHAISLKIEMTRRVGVRHVMLLGDHGLSRR